MRKKNVTSIVVLVVAFMVLNVNFVSCKNMTRNGYAWFEDHDQNHYQGHHHHALYGGHDHDQYPLQIRRKMEEGGGPDLDIKCSWESCNLLKQDCDS